MATKYIVNNVTGQTINGQSILPYKVYTALLTQIGGNETGDIQAGNLTIGVTYQIVDNSGSGWDFTNVGAPNNDIGTYFIATGTTPNSWGVDGQLNYNDGAPVAIILENTIGNIWFNYEGDGMYAATSDDLFTIGKTWNTNVIVLGVNGPADRGVLYQENSSVLGIRTESDVDVPSNNILSSTPIEIRVYN